MFRNGEWKTSISLATSIVGNYMSTTLEQYKRHYHIEPNAQQIQDSWDLFVNEISSRKPTCQSQMQQKVQAFRVVSISSSMAFLQHQAE
jgi:hypothetical protein